MYFIIPCYNENMKVGIFDSGIGGVTVLREILRVLPRLDYVYYSDSANNPYGERDAEEICALSLRACEYLIGAGCEAIVIACNTASANAADYLRKQFPDVPIVAIEPAYKMVHDIAPNEPTLVLATQGTLHSEKFARLYHKYDNHQTSLIDCSGLARLIEDEDEQLMNFLWVRLGNYHDQVKNVVLGCTHYPLVRNELAEVLGSGVKFFNGAPAVAKHLREVLVKRGLITEDEELLNEGQVLDEKKNLQAQIKFYDTSGEDGKAERFWKIVESVV